MIQDFQKFLQRVRQNYNLDKKIFIKYLVVYFLLVSTGILLDITLPFSVWFNLIRTLIVILQGTIFFVIIYIYFLCIDRTKFDVLEKFDDRLDRKHRINLSILIVSLLVIGNVLLVPVPSPVYSFFFSFIVSSLIFVFSFVNS